MAELTLKHVTKTYEDGFTAVDAISLTIKPGAFVVLVGPSGCGKSTTLRMIAGLETITSGELRIGDRVMNSVRPKDRDIAMVFQNYALYPHLSVAENMGFSLRMGHVGKKQRNEQVARAARMLGLESILTKKPGQLSGGQRQRVALGRAIVREPEVFLFDEPLSNLDPDRRVSTRAEIRRIVRELGTTTVYVTHDHEEAMALGDVVVVMSDGKIEQVGSPEAVYAHPKTLFVARFLGSPKMNTIECPIESLDGVMNAIIQIGPEAEISRIPLKKDADSLMHTDRVVLGIRPQHVMLGTSSNGSASNGSASQGSVSLGVGRVSHIEHLGFAQDLMIQLGSHTLLVRDRALVSLGIGDECTVSFDPTNAHMF